MTKAQAAAYLAGMIDGEGHVRVQPFREITVANTDKDLIDATVECCELLGLRFTVLQGAYDRRGDRKPIWQVRMTGKETLLEVQRTVPLRSKRKVAAIVEGIAAYKNLPRPPREWLEQKYLTEKLSLQQVAEGWGAKSSMSAWNWLKFYEIPRRSQSEALTKYPRPEREWLAARLSEGLSLQEIGDLVGVSYQTVWRWRKHYDLE